MQKYALVQGEGLKGLQILDILFSSILAWDGNSRPQRDMNMIWHYTHVKCNNYMKKTKSVMGNIKAQGVRGGIKKKKWIGL